MAYSAGSVVVLISGGPAMTVISSSGDDVECVWIGDVGELFRHAIPAIALEQVPSDDNDDDDEDEGDEDRDDDDQTSAEDEDDSKKKKKKKEHAD